MRAARSRTPVEIAASLSRELAAAYHRELRRLLDPDVEALATSPPELHLPTTGAPASAGAAPTEGKPGAGQL